jgi:hypothetical protein
MQILHNDDNIHDMIFKGHTMTYLIDKSQIVILGILKYTFKKVKNFNPHATLFTCANLTHKTVT